MSEEDLNTIIQIAKLELANRFKRFEAGLRVKVHAPIYVEESVHKFLLNKTGTIYNVFKDQDNQKVFYSVILDFNENIGTNSYFWDFEQDEITPV